MWETVLLLLRKSFDSTYASRLGGTGVKIYYLKIVSVFLYVLTSLFQADSIQNCIMHWYRNIVLCTCVKGRERQGSRSIGPRPSSTTRRTLSCSRTRLRPRCAAGTPGTRAGSSCSLSAITGPSGGSSTRPHRLVHVYLHPCIILCQ